MRLTRIYTRGGDAGETSLGSGTRVPKTDPRIEAYGTVDELNSLLGLVLAGEISEEARPWLEEIQNDLFDVGADLSVPLSDDRRERLRVTSGQVERLEELCDLVNERLEPLRSFVLPGGTEAARTAARRPRRLPPGRAARRGAGPGAGREPHRPGLSESALGPALHPRPGRERRLSGAVVEAWELAVALAGSFVAGFLGSLVGLVLGSLRLPAVLLASGSAASAAGTNLAVSAVAALTGGITHARAGRVSWRIVAWMAPPSVAGAAVGGYVAHAVPGSLLLAVIAVVLAWNGLDLLFQLRAAPDSHHLAAAVSGGFIGLLGGAVGLILGTLRMPALLRRCGAAGAHGGGHEPWSSASFSARPASRLTSSARRSNGRCWP